MGKVLHIHKDLSSGPQHPGKSYGRISTPTAPAMDEEGQRDLRSLLVILAVPGQL